jgi:predicted dinucleotide-binding enzyme
VKIGVIGAGGVGQAFARQAVRAGFEVVLGNRRGPGSLAAIVSELGPRARAGTREETASADVVFLSVPWEQVPDALAGLPSLAGKVLIDATN